MTRRRGILAVVWSAWAAVCGAADVPAPVLKYPDAYDWCFTLTPGLAADVANPRSVGVRAPTTFRAVVLGEKRTALWLETSEFSRASTEGMGYRLMELGFANPRRDVRELRSEAGDGLQIADAGVAPGAGYLKFALPPRGSQTVVAAYSETTARHEITADTGVKLKLADALSRPKDGVLTLLAPNPPEPGSKGVEPFRRVIALRGDRGGTKFEIVTEFTLTVGQYSTASKTVVPLDALDDVARLELSRWLGGPDKADDPVATTNANICAVWFKAKKRVLVIDLQRLQRAVLTQYLTELQQALTEYDFKAKDYAAASALLGRLLVAETFAATLTGELAAAELARVRTSITNARARIDELIFRLPVKIDADAWVAFYSPRTRTACLLPETVAWTPVADAVPLQFKVPNRDLVFLLTLRSTPDVTAAAMKIADVQRTLAETYQSDELRKATITAGLPETFTAKLALESAESGKVASLKLERCKRDGRNRLLVKLVCSESEAFVLRSLYLGKNGKGLPVDLSVDRFFLGRTVGEPSTLIRGTVSAPDFRIVQAKDQKIPVTVWVDAKVFTAAKADAVTIPFRYPGETTSYPVTVKRSDGSGVVEIPLKTMNDESVLDLEYESPVGKTWVLRRNAVEGFVIVDE